MLARLRPEKFIKSFIFEIYAKFVFYSIVCPFFKYKNDA